MSDYLLSVILGVVEGLTEFLPVSSTAHLRIAEALLRVSLSDGYWKMYTVVIQLGAILALPIYFRERIAGFFSSLSRETRSPLGLLRHPLGLTGVAFVVTAVPSFLFVKVIGEHLESVTVMAWSLLVGGLVMWVVDAVNAGSEAAGPRARGRVHVWTMEEMSVGQAAWIGLCQFVSAIFPGTSRSMATIAGGQVAGMSRAAALEFSFFLSMPTMVVATGYDLLKSVVGRGDNPIGVTEIDAHGWIVLGIGLVVSFIVAYGAVAWFMAYVRRRGFIPFAIYRILLGLALLAFGARLGA